MLIVNPIYDVVFKYLLDDNKVAKLFIGAIIGVEIDELEFRPQELPLLFSDVEETNENTPLVKVFRMDFKAKIIYPDGTIMLVLVELQKAKLDTDLMRFRRYLGAQYIDSKNTVTIDGKNKPLPIITIYFLGYTLRNFEENPVVRVKRHYIDNYTHEIISQKDSFIEALSHDTIVIQIPQIKHKRRNELEEILSIFEEGNKSKFEMRFPFPGKYEEIVKRLNLALTDEQLRYAMIEQAEIVKDYKQKREQLEAYKKGIEEYKEREKEAIKRLLNENMNISKIALIFNRSEEEIKKMI
ncbi:MAG TPA: hypothetical protein VNW06_00885 [Cytophagaceae bacterium]|nr:hypothetical protein [Cytophagaceae bacterium]